MTNFSAMTKGAAEAKLATCGIDATDRIITSAMAAASLVSAGERVLVCAGEGVFEAVRSRGAEVLDAADGIGIHHEIDAVIVGYHRTFDYDRLSSAARAVQGGARLIATNTDPTYPTPDGLLAGNGALVAAVETAGKAEAVVAGKPHGPVADLVHAHLGSSQGDRSNIVVGDLPATDGLLASELGFRFGLVLSGVTSAEDAPRVEPRPDVVASDLAAMVDQVLGGS